MDIIRENKTKHKRIGKITDRMRNIKTGEIVEENILYNTIVDDADILFAYLLKNSTATSSQIYWAVGTLPDPYDDNNPPIATTEESKLENEVFRKAISPTDIEFLDIYDQVSATPTNKIRLNITFLSTEANGELRTMGLFAGNASIAKDSGIMIDKKNHGKVTKSSEYEWDRSIILTL